MNESANTNVGRGEISTDIAVELIHLCLRFLDASDELDFKDLLQDVEAVLARKPMPKGLALTLLRKLHEELQEREMILDAVSLWAQETYTHYTLTSIEPKEWRVAVTSDIGEIFVYATKVWDMKEEDVVILINPGGKLPEPLRY
jgi:hypothetical protein